MASSAADATNYSSPSLNAGGASDVIIVAHADGTLRSTAWHVVFDRVGPNNFSIDKVARSDDKIVTLKISACDLALPRATPHRRFAYARIMIVLVLAVAIIGKDVVAFLHLFALGVPSDQDKRVVVLSALLLADPQLSCRVRMAKEARRQQLRS